MHHDEHWRHCIKTYKRYLDGNLTTNGNHLISDFSGKEPLKWPGWDRCIYVLKLGGNIDFKSITNPSDPMGILYIGGHHPGKKTCRFNELIKSSRNAVTTFNKSGHAWNDKAHSHPVAGSLTTSLLKNGFSIEKCEIELVCGDDFDELELIIGYQEEYHHIPPWNSNRKGSSIIESKEVRAGAVATGVTNIEFWTSQL